MEPVGPRLVRVTFAGDELAGLGVDLPAASVRVLLPPPGSNEPVVPAWNGNEFLLPDGSRPPIRTFTPALRDADAPTLEVQVVLHGAGAAAEWASAVQPGDQAAVSGPGRGYAVDPAAAAYFVAGDETAIPAIGQLLEAIPPSTPVQVHVEVAAPDGRVELPGHAGAAVHWLDLRAGSAPGDAVVDAVTSSELDPDARVWVAGEAAAVQRIRRHLFQERGLPRAQCTVRGYWKHGRRGDADDD